MQNLDAATEDDVESDVGEIDANTTASTLMNLLHYLKQ